MEQQQQLAYIQNIKSLSRNICRNDNYFDDIIIIDYNITFELKLNNEKIQLNLFVYYKLFPQYLGNSQFINEHAFQWDVEKYN